MAKRYLLDTHALLFWVEGTLSADFLAFLDRCAQEGRLFVSPISIWEIALLGRKGTVVIADLHRWTTKMLTSSGIKRLDPTPSEMINSVQLPGYHKDPFDRLLIAQAQANNMTLVTRDSVMQRYSVPSFWL